MTDNTEHAVVIGASVAGLLAACAVSGHFDQVTILEREVLPPPGQSRKLVPQGRHLHVLLPGGLAAIEQLLARLPVRARRRRRSALRLDAGDQVRGIRARDDPGTHPPPPTSSRAVHI
ncbi:MAG TPA: hypothetical protein VJN19_03200 [Propionibacteriaceae bacterium]|nr:hypothetical protein [Propionibacteriaceae bacterium]